MASLLNILSQRSIYISMAVIGAVLVVVGNVISLKLKSIPRLGKFILKLGYLATWSSVVLFIYAGFQV